MPSIATITGKIGPAVTLTTVVFNNVTKITLDTDNEVLTIDYVSPTLGPKIASIDVSAQTTWTLTVSGNTYTLTVS